MGPSFCSGSVTAAPMPAPRPPPAIAPMTAPVPARPNRPYRAIGGIVRVREDRGHQQQSSADYAGDSRLLSRSRNSPYYRANSTGCSSGSPHLPRPRPLAADRSTTAEAAQVKWRPAPAFRLNDSPTVGVTANASAGSGPTARAAAVGPVVVAPARTWRDCPFRAPCDKNRVSRRAGSVNCDQIVCRIGVGLE